MADPASQFGDHTHAHPVGQPTEDEVEAVDRVDVVGVVGAVAVDGGQARVEVGDGGAGLGVAGGDHDIEALVTGQQSQQLGARVAGSADDADAVHGCIHRNIIRISA